MQINQKEFQILTLKSNIKIYEKIRRLYQICRSIAIIFLVSSLLFCANSAISFYLYVALVIETANIDESSITQFAHYGIWFAVAIAAVVVAGVFVKRLSEGADDCGYEISAAKANIKKINDQQ